MLCRVSLFYYISILVKHFLFWHFWFWTISSGHSWFWVFFYGLFSEDILVDYHDIHTRAGKAPSTATTWRYVIYRSYLYRQYYKLFHILYYNITYYYYHYYAELCDICIYVRVYNKQQPRWCGLFDILIYIYII